MVVRCVGWMASVPAERFLYFGSTESRAGIWYQWDAFGPPGGLGCCPFWGSGSVVVDFLSIVTPIVGVCNCSLFCCTLLHVHSSIAVVLMGKRELIALLNLSSWCLVVVGRLFLAVPRGCQQFVIVVFPDHTHYFGLLQQIDVSQICDN